MHFFGCGRDFKILLRNFIYLVGLIYFESIWIFTQRETSKSEVIQGSVGRRNEYHFRLNKLSRYRCLPASPLDASELANQSPRGRVKAD